MLGNLSLFERDMNRGELVRVCVCLILRLNMTHQTHKKSYISLTKDDQRCLLYSSLQFLLVSVGLVLFKVDVNIHLHFEFSLCVLVILDRFLLSAYM